MTKRVVGVDIGAENIKLVELTTSNGRWKWCRRLVREHNKEPGRLLKHLLKDWKWNSVTRAACTGRFSRGLRLARVPIKQAQSEGYRFLFGDGPATVVSIGNHGFSVLELRESGPQVFRENSRCSQGTGNFLRQLVERFDLDLQEADALCAGVDDAAPLSGRCPVILKTDMTHLANKGEARAPILAGLYDAVCENVQVLIKPRISPPRVVLVGGVTRAPRIQDNFDKFLARHNMTRVETEGDDALFFEALGCAALAAEDPGGDWAPGSLQQLLAPLEENLLDELPPLSGYLHKVSRMMVLDSPPLTGSARDVILGFDIGSTGSKAVAMDVETRELLWEGYLATSGNPVRAAQSLMKQLVDSGGSRYKVGAVGVTGSGREVVGSLLATCYGVDRVYVLNEIAAHAQGATYFDPRVDTIFEIGGQDAKYIRLSEGRVVDAAMNEACSAGTGSFIEEQGRKFSGIRDVVHLGAEALEATSSVSLGQHCSVFMAEIIDEAVAAGAAQRSIIAGIYDAIVQNYLNRVRGSRTVGDVIFCQGMPFAAPALAAAVARQTGSEVIVPPKPGLMGAIGISLLTLEEIALAEQVPISPDRFLNARVVRKDTFVCKSKVGCGGAGNKCRVDRLHTVVEGVKQKFTWGGGCSLYDKGTGKHKLPDMTPDPFRDREALISEIVQTVSRRRGRFQVAMTDEFMLKGLFPFFATFLYELGFDLVVRTGADQAALKRGIEEANIPFCAPMQQFHGLVSELAARGADFLFVPMIRNIPNTGEKLAKVCPIVQASADMLRWDLGEKIESRLISTVIDFGKGDLESDEFIESCQQVASDLGVGKAAWRGAHRKALEVQETFDARCLELGREALEFCETHDVVPVVVLGRVYTIHNQVLNSNVPSILREQGALPVPVDCYPLDEDVPIFNDIYWGYAQNNLRAAHQVRRREGQYAVFCSNYSCGPDSFSLHFFNYIMEGKPFSVLETDGHAGDAGTKTRIEAFLYCVHQDRKQPDAGRPVNRLEKVEEEKDDLAQVRELNERVLIPRMGPGAEALAAALRGVGVAAEALPMPTTETVRLGRRHTSGKECVPMCITMGGLLERLEQDREAKERFSFFMPTANGPCRFGVYNLLHKIILERLGWKDRVRVWSPADSDYFKDLPPGFASLIFTGFMANDLLREACYDVRPVESEPGKAKTLLEQYEHELYALVEAEGKGDLSLSGTLLQIGSGRLYGVADLLERAARAFADIKEDRSVPTVLLVGEIYVRCDPFANDFTIDRLEDRGIRVRFAPFNEWIEYTDYLGTVEGRRSLSAHLASYLRRNVQERTYGIMAEHLGWHQRTRVTDSLDASSRYLRSDLHGEAVLTIGGPIHEWREGYIDGVVSVGPLECMPNKISEAQFFHVAEREGLLSLTLSLNGDPIDATILDNFTFDVQEHFRRRMETDPGTRQALHERSRRALRNVRRASARWLATPLRVPLQAMAAAASRGGASSDEEQTQGDRSLTRRSRT